MKIHIREKKINLISKEWEVLINGIWTPLRELKHSLKNDEQVGIGKFEHMQLSKEKILKLVSILEKEDLKYQYEVSKNGDNYYII